jgi:hypothetical protein
LKKSTGWFNTSTTLFPDHHFTGIAMTANATTLIKNGRIITATDDYVADVLLQGGVIHTIGRDLVVGPPSPATPLPAAPRPQPSAAQPPSSTSRCKPKPIRRWVPSHARSAAPNRRSTLTTACMSS